MNIKEILLNGGSVKFPYKEKDEDWVSEASRIDSKEIDWIEQDLAQVREEKINQILK